MNLKGVDPRWVLYLAAIGAASYVVWKANKAAGQAAGVLGGAADSVGEAAHKVYDMVTWTVPKDERYSDNVANMPPPEDVLSDPATARWVIDHQNGGYLTAMKWFTAGAVASAWNMTPGTGRPPAAGSELAQAMGVSAPGQRNAAPSAPAVNIPSWTPSPGTTFEDMSGGSFDYFTWNG